MGIYPRKVKNKKDASGNPTGQAGIVYDVAFRYKENDVWMPYAKRGFFDKGEAEDHERAMKKFFAKQNGPSDRKRLGFLSVGEYLDFWIADYAPTAVVSNTLRGYKTNINKHITPHIGNIMANQLTQFDLDKLYKKLLKTYTGATVSYVHSTISSAWTTGVNYYECFQSNPAFKIQTNFDLTPKEPLPDPYTVEELKALFDALVDFGDWEFIVCMGGLFGSRRNEILGMEEDHLTDILEMYHIEYQLRHDVKRDAIMNGEKLVVPVKKKVSNRILPITDIARPFFERQIERIERNKRDNSNYVDNGLLVCRKDGWPYDSRNLSSDWKALLLKLGMRHIRLHDLRHTAATIMHTLTGDFYTISGLLGHTLRGMGNHVGFVPVQNATPVYIKLTNERKLKVLNEYHTAIFYPKSKLVENSENK